MLRIFVALGVGLATVGRVLWLSWNESRMAKRVAHEVAMARAAAVADQQRAAAWRGRHEVN